MLQSLSGLFVPVGLGEEALAAPGALETLGEGVRKVATGTAAQPTKSQQGGAKSPDQRRRDIAIGAGVVGAGALYYFAVYRPAAEAQQAAQAAAQAQASQVPTGAPSSASGAGSVPVGATQPPSQPLQPTVTAVTSTTASLMLSPVAGAGQYEVVDATTGDIVVPSVTDVTQPVVITGLTPGQTYAFAEVAINQNGSSAPGLPVNVTTQTSTAQSGATPPQCPAGMVATYYPGTGWACVLPQITPGQVNPIAYIAGQGFDYPPGSGTYPVIDSTTGQETGTVTVSNGTITGTTGSGGPPVGSQAVAVATTTPTTTTTTTPTTTTTTAQGPVISATGQQAAQPNAPTQAARLRQGFVYTTRRPTPLIDIARAYGFGSGAGLRSLLALNPGLTAGSVLPAGYGLFIPPSSFTTRAQTAAAARGFFGSATALPPGQEAVYELQHNQNLTTVARYNLLEEALRAGALTEAQAAAFRATNVPLSAQAVRSILAGQPVVVTPTAQAARASTVTTRTSTEVQQASQTAAQSASRALQEAARAAQASGSARALRAVATAQQAVQEAQRTTQAVAVAAQERGGLLTVQQAQELATQNARAAQAVQIAVQAARQAAQTAPGSVRTQAQHAAQQAQAHAANQAAAVNAAILAQQRAAQEAAAQAQARAAEAAAQEAAIARTTQEAQAARAAQEAAAERVAAQQAARVRAAQAAQQASVNAAALAAQRAAAQAAAARAAEEAAARRARSVQTVRPIPTVLQRKVRVLRIP
jgi:hypothetical protein